MPTGKGGRGPTPPRKNPNDGQSSSAVQFILTEEYSDSDTDLQSNTDSDSDCEEFITPPESPVMPELLSDRTASEEDSDSDIDWYAIDEYDGSYTTTDSGINTPETSPGGTDDDFLDDITDTELSAIMDNYDTEM